MSNEMQWEEPPSPPRKQGSVIRFIAGLKERPRQWAKYPGDYSDNATQYNNKIKFPGTEWRQARNPDTDRWDLWGRWIGDES